MPAHRLNEDHDVSRARLREIIRTGLWFTPSMFVVGAMASAYVLHRLDMRLSRGDAPAVAYGGDADSAQEMLSMVASTTMTFTGLVFSITVVALQLASSQFSPRVLRAFLRDNGSKVPLGIFVATFVYTLLVLRTVRPATDVREAFVPGLSIAGAFVLVLLSLGAFVYYVHHIANSIRAVSIIESVAREARTAIDENYPPVDHEPAAEAPTGPPDHVIPLDRAAGALLGVDEDDLCEIARRAGCVLRLVPSTGDYVPEGAPLFEVFGGDGSVGPDDVLPHVGVGVERTMYQDVSFGIRQLVDVAERALSPAINDPTTAVQAIDRIHDLLRRLATRPTPSGCHRDRDGVVRLHRCIPDWSALVVLSFEEIRQYGAASIQVNRRLQAVLADLRTVASADRQPPLERQQALLAASVARTFPEPEDQRMAGIADGQGLGA